jgi:hypothetical protein
VNMEIETLAVTKGLLLNVFSKVAGEGHSQCWVADD